MKILLLQDVRNVGRKDEVKNVSDGYARNFLIARKLAVPADEGAMKIKAQSEARESGLIKKFEEQVEKLEKESLKFEVKTGKKGEIFSSIKNEDINKLLKQKGYEGQAVLDHPIKDLGEHKITVNFPRGVRGEAIVIIKTVA